MESRIVELISNCYLSRLSKDFHDVKEVHPEYQLRNSKLEDNFPALLRLLDKQVDQKLGTSTLAQLLILNYELQSNGPWNSIDTKHTEYVEKLYEVLDKQNIKIYEILQNDLYETQSIFDSCIMDLHKKLTVDNFRKYPSFIEVYSMLITHIKYYKININPIAVLPVALLLLEDYNSANKIKGLYACSAILQCLTTESFTGGNYYEVVYSSLKKNVVERSEYFTEALQYSHVDGLNCAVKCFTKFLTLLPPDVKKNKLDDIYASVLDILYVESYLYRKVAFLEFTKNIIEMHRIHCAKKKIFKEIICDNIDICSSETDHEELLPQLLECLKTWLKYCWCVWRLSTDHVMISSLFKILYISKDTMTKSKIQHLILTLITLCSKEEQMYILENLREPPQCSNQDFLARLEKIKKLINS